MEKQLHPSAVNQWLQKTGLISLFIILGFITSLSLSAQQTIELLQTRPALTNNTVVMQQGEMLEISVPATVPGSTYRIQRTWPQDNAYLEITSTGGLLKVPAFRVNSSGKQIITVSETGNGTFAQSFTLDAKAGLGMKAEDQSLFPANTGGVMYGPMSGEVIVVVPGLVSNTSTVCGLTGGYVTASIQNSISGNTYKIQQTYPGGLNTFEELTGNGGTITFQPMLVVPATSGNPIITITNISQGNAAVGSFIVNLIAQPTAPTMTKLPNTTAVCVGAYVSAAFLTAGSGGVAACADSYQYRTNGGTWSTYNPGDAISTTGFTSVDIRALRSDNTGAGCSSENIYSWTVNALPVPAINGPTDVCANSIQTYTTEAEMQAYSWIVTGGTGSSSTNSIDINWGSAGSGQVEVNYADANGCNAAANSTISVTKTDAPSASSITLRSTIDNNTWQSVNGDLSSGFNCYIYPCSDYTYLDVSTFTASTDILQDYLHPFHLNQTGLPSGWNAYWAAKGVVQGATGWQGVMYEIINGNQPIFYLKKSGSDYLLIDGLLYQTGQGEQTLRISGDYPLGAYTYDGDLHATAGCYTSLSIGMTFERGILNQTLQLVYGSIQAAIDGSADGNTIEVCDGTYSGNITVNKNISLVSKNGAAATLLDGDDSGSHLGTITLTSGRNGVVIGQTDKGFTIKGIDGPPGLEKASVYLQGTQQNITVEGNILEARGDAALMGECNAVNNNITINNNQITGQTFDGTEPATGVQFTVPNVARQAVVFGGGPNTTNTGNFIFTNNTISTIAGGVLYGNGLVTLDLVGTNIITGNTFGGTTLGTNAALRVRGSGAYAIEANRFVGNYSRALTREGAPIEATCNWWGTASYETIYSMVGGYAVFVPYLLTDESGAACAGGPALPGALTLTYTEANEDILVAFNVTANELELQPVPGLNPTDPNYLNLVTDRYNALAIAMQSGIPAEIQAAALAVGDDIITEYYYLDGATKVYLKTISANDLVKNKYWDKYLVGPEPANIRYPDWANSITLVPQANYRTHTNPGTGSVADGWLNPVLGRNLYVTVTFINNGYVNSITESVAIPAGCIVNTNTGLGYPTIQAAIDDASNGDVIEVCAGTYIENASTQSFALGTKQGLKLIGATDLEGNPTTIINGSLYLNDNDGGKVENIKFVYNTTLSLLSLQNTNGLEIKNCVFEGNNFTTTNIVGIKHVSGPNGNSAILVEDCYFVDGLHVSIDSRFGSSPAYSHLFGLKVRNSKFDNVKSGINQQSADDVIVENSEFNLNGNNSYGVRFASATDIANNLSITGSVFKVAPGYTASYAIHLRAAAGGTIVASNNSIGFEVWNQSTTMLNATCNWWGTEDPYDIADMVEGDVQFLPFLVVDNTSGTTYPWDNVNDYSCDGIGPVVNVTNDPDRSFMTIQAAIDAPTTITGDVIEVSAGTYTYLTEGSPAPSGLIKVTKGVTLRPQGTARPIIDGSDFDGVFKIHPSALLPGNTVIIEGFEIKGNVTTGIAMTMQGCFDVTPAKVIIRDNWFHGMVGGIDFWGAGAYLPDGWTSALANIEISGNKFYDMVAAGPYPGFGILIEDPANRDNADNDYAVKIENNEFANLPTNVSTSTPGVGIAITRADDIWEAANVYISGNSFSSDVTVGVAFQDGDVSDALVTGNSFSNSVYAILATGIDNGPVDATCNWYNTTDAYAVAAKVSGDVQFLPFSTSASPMNCLGIGPVTVWDDTHTTLISSHMEIQSAIDDPSTLDNCIITVAPGIYKQEWIYVDKSVKIHGPNLGIPGVSSTRGSEAILRFPDDTEGWSGIFYIVADNVVVDGFTISDEGGLSSNEFTGVFSYQASNTQISNNIIDGFNYISLWMHGDGNPAVTPRFSSVIGNYLVNNHGLYHTIYLQGIGGSVTNNTVENCAAGLQIQPYAQPFGGTVENNNFQAYVNGMYHNYASLGSGNWTYSNNSVSAVVPPSGGKSATNKGIGKKAKELGIILPDNQDAALDLSKSTYDWIGIHVRTHGTSGSGAAPEVEFTSGNNVDGTTALTDPYWNDVIGLQFRNTGNNALTKFYNNGISNVDYAIKVYNDANNNSLVDLDNNNFSNYSYAILVEPDMDIDASSGNTYNGIASNSATTIELFTIEDAIIHKIDESSRGLVTVKTGELFVTPLSYAGANTTPLIQRGIDAASAGFIVNVAPGTFAENLNVNKGVTLKGANAGVACGSRTAESILAPASGVPVTIGADGVTLNGFELTAPSSFYGIIGSGYSNQHILFNNIHDVGTTASGANVHSIINMIPNGTATENVTIADNCFNNISSSLLTGYSASAIGILQSSSTGTLTGLNIERNTISNVNVNTGNWPTGKIAYGIIINVGSANYASTNGKVVDALISANEISGLSGFISTGIALEGNTEDAIVQNNYVANLSGNKVANRAGGGYDLQGLKFETNRFVETCTVANNSFATDTYTHGTINGAGYAVANYVPSANGGVLTLGCNWYGTEVYNEIVDNVDLTGRILNKDGCETSFVPYLVSGADNETTTIGFQPTPGTCEGEPVVIASAVPAHIYCGGSTGSILVNFSGGSPNYNIDWGSGNATGITGSPYTISGLGAGSYTITVTDTYGSSDMITAEVLYLPVTNITQTTYYVNLPDAYNAANENDVLEVCAGTYALDAPMSLNKSITIQGQGKDNTTFEISSAWFTNPIGHAFEINAIAANVTIKDLHFKVIGKGQGNILQIYGSNRQILNNKFSGEYVAGDGEVTRATEWSAVTGITFSGNIVESLRQPGYINNGSGVINSNVVNNTKGWVIAETFTGTLAITQNSFGTNASHITILTGANVTNLSINENDLSGAVLSGGYAIDDRLNGTLNATCNWWGTTTNLGSMVAGNVDYTPWLISGADDTGIIGFQPQVACDSDSPVGGVLTMTTTLYPAGIIAIPLSGIYTIAPILSFNGIDVLQGISLVVTDANLNTADVPVYINGDENGFMAYDAVNGIWNYAGQTSAPAFSDGLQTVTVTFSDLAGNTTLLTLHFTTDATPPALLEVTPLAGAQCMLGQNFVLTVQALDANLYSLEIDHSMEGSLPEFSVYASESDPYGGDESQFTALGVTVVYSATLQQWTIDFGAVITQSFITTGGITFYAVLKDLAGNEWGSMSPTTPANTFVYTFDNVTPVLGAVTPAEGAQCLLGENFVWTVQASDANLYSLEIDHSMEATLPEFSVYASESDPYGGDESQFTALGVTVVYSATLQQWTIDYGAILTEAFINNGGITFYTVLEDCNGNALGTMYGTTPENTFAYTFDNQAPELVEVTPAEGAQCLDGNFIWTVQASDDNLYSLEIDHNMAPALPEFTVYADASNVYGSPEAATEFANAGVSVTYNDATQTWAFDFGPAVTQEFINNGGITFYTVIRDCNGNAFGSMSPTNSANTFAYDLNRVPTATIAPDQTQSICSGSNVTINVDLTGTAPWSITYTDGTTPVTVSGITSSPFALEVTPTANTTYTVNNVTDANGCSNVGTGSASIYLGPVVTAATIASCTNSVIEVPVTVTDFNNVGVLSLTLNYDKNVMTFNGFTNTDGGITFTNLDVIAHEGGSQAFIKIGKDLTSSSTLPANSTLITLKFNYLTGYSELTWDDTYDIWCEFGSGPPDFVPFCDDSTAHYYINGSVGCETFPPSFTAPDDLTIYRDASCGYDASVTVTGDVIDETDNCGVGEATYSDAVNSTDPCSVIITRTWSLVDNCGNSAANQVQIITVKDNTAPLVTAPSTADIECSVGIPVAATTISEFLALAGADASDNCTSQLDLTVTSTTRALAGSNCSGTITRTYTITDACGKFTSVDQVFTVTDNTAPTMTGPADRTIEGCSELTALPESKQILVATTQAPNTYYVDRYAPHAFSVENYLDADRLKHEINAADCQSCRPTGYNTAFYNTQGRKYDTPGALSLAIDLYVPSDWATTGRRMAGLWGTAFDATDAISLYPIIEFASDGAGPSFRCYNNGDWIVMGLPSGFTYDNWYTLSIQLVGSSVVYTVGDLTATIPSNNSESIGNMILQGHNTDTPGVTYNIYWDNFKTLGVNLPYSSVSAPVSASQYAAEGGSATDNCSSVSITYADSKSGTCPTLVNRVFTVQDLCGNISTKTQVITIDDNTPPMVTAGFIASCYSTVELAEAAAIAVTTATDNCTGTLTMVASTNGTCEAVITVTVTDGCGNSASVTYNTRIDNTPPTVTAGSIASCYSTVELAEAAAIAATTATDNCTGTLTKVASTTGTCEAVITVTVTDGCGNSASVIYNTRIDNTPPNITPPADVTVYTNAGCTATGVELGTPDVSDNCTATANIGVSNTAPSAYPLGTTTVTWTATDACGNPATATQTVTVLGATVSGTVKYYNTALTPMYNVVNVELRQDGSLIKGPVSTDASGNYSFADVCSGIYDVVFNTTKSTIGAINATDAAQANFWVVNKYSIERVRFNAGDVTNDHRIISNDASNILSYFVTNGNPVPPFASEWSFWNVGETINNNPAPTPYLPQLIVPGGYATVTQNFYAMVTGDFNRSFIPGGAKAVMENVMLNIGGTTLVEPGVDFELPVTAGLNIEVGAVSLIIDLPTDKLEVAGVYLGTDPTSPMEYAVVGNELRIGWNALFPMSLNTGEALLTLKLRTIGSMAQGETIRLSLTADPLNELADGNYNTIPNALLFVDEIGGIATGVPDITFSNKLLLECYPNPFVDKTTFAYTLPKEGKVVLEMADMLGSKTDILLDALHAAGSHTFTVDMSSYSVGIYTATLRLHTGNDVISRTIKVIRRK